MGQVIKVFKPSYVNTDADAMSLKPVESPFIKDYTVEVNDNGELPSNTGNDVKVGGNMNVGTPLSANIKLCTPELPDGFNKIVGSGEFTETNELYVCFYNSKGKHGVYLIDGNTMRCRKIIFDANLNFSLDPAFAIPAHKMSLRVVYDEQNGELRSIVEKHLIFTDSNNWQRWINVEAAIKTDGFNEVLFPYWKTRLPHFDRAEYIDYITRPPMHCPSVIPVPFSDTDKGKINKLLNESVQFAYDFIYTDGRPTSVSQYSLPFSVTSSSCNPNSANLSRCVDIVLYAGSPMVEKIRLYMRPCGGEWVLYDTIERFSTCGDNDPALIGNEYWKRTGQWADVGYDPVKNTIKYRWCGDKEFQIADKEHLKRLQNDMPIKSIAMTPAGDAILLCNNLYGYENLSCSVTDKIALSTIPDDATAGCKVDMVKITVYSYMGSGDYFHSQAVYKRGAASTSRDFGGFFLDYSRSGTTVNEEFSLNQGAVDYFGMKLNNKDGHILYLAGTPYYAIGKQCIVTAAGVIREFGIPDFNSNEEFNFVKAWVQGGGFFVEKYEFTVPKGKYIARMAGHSSMPDDDYSKTSTWVMGIADSRIRTQGGAIVNFYQAKKSYSKEIEIDATNGNVDLWGTGADLFYIFCPYYFDSGALFNVAGDAERWRFNEGYVNEDNQNKIGVELLRYGNNHGQFFRDGFFTDHNGFFFAFVGRGEARYAEVDFRGTLNCKTTNNVLFSSKNGSSPGGLFSWGADSVYVKYNATIKDNNAGIIGDCNRVLVKGKITDCDGVNGLAGVAVTITRGATAYTGSDGTFELIVHNSYEAIRKDKIYVNAGGECLFYTCDCKAPELYPYDSSLSPCVACNVRNYPTSIDAKFKLVVGRNKALKGGGRYGVGMVAWDLGGRGTFVNRINYVDIPTFLQTNSYAPQKIKASFPASLGLPKGTAYVSFFRTPNLNFRSYLQWVGDGIKFLDTKGDEVTTKGGLIRAKITIQSLLDFNVDNNFATTAKYQINKGDIIRIYDDGDGTSFNPTATDGYMDYPILGTNYNESVQTQINVQANGSNITFNPEQQTDGKSIIIGYDKRLESLRDKCGFWIEVIRPKEISEREMYCEMCGMYPVQDGELMGGIREIIFDTWDTYYQNRYIKIKDCSGKAFNHPFEGASITDFWGENCTSCGRLHTTDAQAEQRWYPDDVIKSDEFVNEGRVNGLATFRERNRKQFKGQDWGGIVAAKAAMNIVAFICQNDWFLTGYDLNYVKSTSDGRIIATNLENNLDSPYQKVGDNYGCEYEHTSSIVYHDGKIFWADSKNRAVILMDFKSANAISEIDNSSYFSAKFTTITKYNKNLSPANYKNRLFDLIAGIDHARNEYYLTFRRRNIDRQMPINFVNLERKIALDKSETFVFSINNSKWTRWATIIPEFYGSLKHAKEGKLMIVFNNGMAWGHNLFPATLFNTFFGFRVPAMCVVVESDPDNKNKIYQSVEVESNSVRWYVDEVVTPEPFSYSYIPVKYFKKKENIQYASVLRDMSSYPSDEDLRLNRSMLLDGKRMFGQFGRFRFLVYIDDADKYFEVGAFNIRNTFSEKTGK
jgi:hypothetical protein